MSNGYWARDKSGRQIIDPKTGMAVTRHEQLRAKRGYGTPRYNPKNLNPSENWELNNLNAGRSGDDGCPGCGEFPCTTSFCLTGC